MLGIDAGAIALTKVDAVSADRVDEVLLQIADRAGATAAAHWPVFPVSSLSGDGVGELHASSTAGCGEPRGENDCRSLSHGDRRCFTLSGVGTIVTGTVHAGEVRVGDSVSVAPTSHAR